MDPAKVTVHRKDRKLLDAYRALEARGERITDQTLSAESGLGRKSVKNRRQRLARRALWPGRPVGRSRQRLSTEIEQFILDRAAAPNRPTYEDITREVSARFGRSIDPKAVGNVINRPCLHWLKQVQKQLRAECLREFRTRHDPNPYGGEPAWQILRRLSAAEGRVRGLSRPDEDGVDGTNAPGSSSVRLLLVANYDSKLHSDQRPGDELPSESVDDLLSTEDDSAASRCSWPLTPPVLEGSFPC
jgi:hypothetical protein